MGDEAAKATRGIRRSGGIKADPAKNLAPGAQSLTGLLRGCAGRRSEPYSMATMDPDELLRCV
jgi:hypothetical protein